MKRNKFSSPREKFLQGLAEKEYTHKYRCPACCEEVEIAQEDILTESDWTEATGVQVKSHRCPYCGTRNIITYKAANGVKVTYINVKKIERR